MTARKTRARKVSAKKTAARKTTEVEITEPSLELETLEPAPTPEPEPEAEANPADAPLRVRPDDTRPEAWRLALIAHARGEGVPRNLRVLQDPRITGPERRLQMKALGYVGMSAEDAAEVIVEAAMKENRGRRTFDW